MTHKLDRRDFIRRLLTVSAAGAAWGLTGCGSRPTPDAAIPPAEPTRTLFPTAAAIPPTARPNAATPTTVTTGNPTAAPTIEPAPPPAAPATAAAAYLAVARGAGADPAELTRRAIAALGGIEQFVKPGADVIVKPNICNAYHGPEYASTTNPDVVAAIIALCLGAGAKRVRVMDFPFGGSPQASYETSGIAAAVKAAGGEMATMNRLKFNKTAIPQGKILRSSNICSDILDADTVINVPIAKTHGSATLTLGMKNLMGVIQDRNTLHARGLHQCIADLNSAVKPQLTVVDAIRILAANGPTGGNLDDVQRLDIIIASADVVAADAYATGLFGMKPADVKYIKLGAEMGLGTLDLGSIRIEEIAV
jgi:uncharacterized protein (DUF362 family)